MITASTIDKVFFDHGMTKGLLERLDAVLMNPKALYKSETVPGGAVVVTFEVKGGNPIVVAIHPNKLMGRSRFNVIASLYAKDTAIETRWQTKGLLVWTPPVAPVAIAAPVVQQVVGPVKPPEA